MSNNQKLKTFITARFTQEGVDKLSPFLDIELGGYGAGQGIMAEDDFLEKAKSMEVLIVELEPVSRKVIDAATHLKVICSCRGTPSNVDLNYATERGIPVLYTPGRNAVSVAELTIALMMNLARKIIPAATSLKKGEWGSGDNSPFITFRGVELYGKNLGIVGFGAIGVEVAKRALALGMRVRAYDPYVPEDYISGNGIQPSSFNDLLSTSDFISLHAKVTEHSRSMIGKSQLAMMKKTACIINTAGGALIDESSLIEALKNHDIGGAGLDVFKNEPVEKDNPLLTLPNVVATPHIGGATSDITNHQTMIAAEDIIRVLQNDRPKFIANPKVFDLR